MFRIHYFHNAGIGRWAALFGAVALQLILGTRVWYMVDSGFGVLHSDVGQFILASIVAPFVAFLALYLFMHGGYAKHDARAYDIENGKYVKQEPTSDGKTLAVRYNRFPTENYVDLLQLIVLGMEWAGIVYVAASDGMTHWTLVGNIVFFWFLSIISPILGRLLYASVNRPLHVDRTHRERSRALAQLRLEEQKEKASMKVQKPPRHVRAPIEVPQLSAGRTSVTQMDGFSQAPRGAASPSSEFPSGPKPSGMPVRDLSPNGREPMTR